MKFDDLIGIPFKPHGRTQDGLDCFGLIWVIHKRLDKPIVDVWYKGFDPELIKLADQMNVEQCELEEGCIIEMEREGRLHLGYALDNKTMIHCTINEGVIVEPIPEYKGCYRWV